MIPYLKGLSKVTQIIAIIALVMGSFGSWKAYWYFYDQGKINIGRQEVIDEVKEKTDEALKNRAQIDADVEANEDVDALCRELTGADCVQ